ncbi:MAG TPA: hypothetical protein VMC02_12535 [Steroidobacteraceae bacterium]|nr:hypothetical protein [Steroidobacteraceae bacterium]
MAKVRLEEFRKFTLPIETVVDALLELDRSHGGTLAQGRLTEARVETGADPGLTLVIVQGAGGAAAAVEKHFTLPAIAAAIIHYCSRVRIPLPRQGKKSIEILGEGVQFTIQALTELPRMHGEVPQVSHVRVESRSPEPAPIVAAGDAALDDPTSSDVEEAATAA